MAGRNIPAFVAFLFLVLMPQMVLPGKYPRFTMSPRAKKQLRDFFKDHASDMADLLPTNGGSGSNGGGRSQAPATTAGMYLYTFDVGTPPQRVSAALDITSDVIWLQCGCDATATAACVVTVPTPFYPLRSTSAAEVPCTNRTCQALAGNHCAYELAYAGGTATSSGWLATEAFAFGAARVGGVVFGCGFSNLGGGGVAGAIGLGRGPFSLASQLQAGRFSYHFAPDDSVGADGSFVLFGGDAAPRTPARAQSTRLLASRVYPKLYYVGLSGIRVDGADLAVPRGTFDLRADGSGGTVLSITIPATFLDEAAYRLLRQALVTRIGLPTVDGLAAFGLDLCYTTDALATRRIPALALVFDGGAVMELETWNYFFLDATTGLECLSILPAPARGGSVLGNLIQAGTHMIYDIDGSVLHFESLQPQASQRRSGSAPAISVLPVLVVANLVLCAVVYMFL